MTTDSAVPSKQELLNYLQELKGASKAYRKALARIAFYGWRLIQYESWTDLGYATEDDLRHALDIPYSTWRKHTRLGSILRGLSLEELESIPVRNLELLAQIEPDQWPEHDWVNEAKSMESEELAELITKRNYANGVAKEPMETVRFRVPCTAKPMIEAAVARFQEENEISTPGRALELWMADQLDRVNLLGAMIKTDVLLKEHKQLLTDKGILDMDVHDSLENIARFVRAEVAKKIQQAREAAYRQAREERRNGAAAVAGGQGGVEAAEDEAVAESAGTLLGLPSGDESCRGVAVR